MGGLTQVPVPNGKRMSYRPPSKHTLCTGLVLTPLGFSLASSLIFSFEEGCGRLDAWFMGSKSTGFAELGGDATMPGRGQPGTKSVLQQQRLALVLDSSCRNLTMVSAGKENLLRTSCGKFEADIWRLTWGFMRNSIGINLFSRTD